MFNRLYLALLVGLTPVVAFAGSAVVPPITGRAPEPETLALIGIGIVALVVAKTRKRK